jgi:hypothetical protein
MRIHSINKIKEIKNLRRQGLSINEIVEKIRIPKTTVWHHIKDVQVLPEYIKLLSSKRGGSKERAKKGWDLAAKNAVLMLQDKNTKDLSILAAMLYWAEGNKKSCEFINSDGKMVKLYLKFLREILHLPEDRIKPIMRIFTGMKEMDCLLYWSTITEIPKDRFVIRLNDGGTSGKTPYGMCRIVVRKGKNVLKLLHCLKNEVVKREFEFAPTD